MDIKLWYSKNMKQWRWTLFDNQLPIHKSGQKYDLREAMIKNPHMKVLFANGLYDLATPFFAAEYTAAHMNLPSEIQNNIILTYYEAGHMMYFHRESHEKLTADVFDFFKNSI